MEKAFKYILIALGIYLVYRYWAKRKAKAEPDKTNLGAKTRPPWLKNTDPTSTDPGTTTTGSNPGTTTTGSDPIKPPDPGTGGTTTGGGEAAPGGDAGPISKAPFTAPSFRRKWDWQN